MSGPPKIVLDARTVRGGPGGVSTYTLALIRDLPALLPAVPFLLLRHPDAPAPLSRAPNVTELVLGGNPHSPWTYWRMGAWLRPRLSAGDLFHAPYRVLARGLPGPSVVTMHDLMQMMCPELVMPNRLKRPFERIFYTVTIPYTLARADRILVPSEHTASDARRLDRGCGERIRVTPLAAASSFVPLDPVEALARTRHLVPAGRRFLFVLGGGYRNKNHGAAVAAFERAFPPPADVSLLLVERERTLPPEVRRILAGSAVRARVVVTPRVTEGELVALYNRAEALVFPSLYEGFGIPLLEAMACGCPVIASTATSVPEVTGDAALLCAPDDVAALAHAMHRVATEPETRRDLAQRGAERVKRFDWHRTVRSTIEVYREIAPWVPQPRSVE